MRGALTARPLLSLRAYLVGLVLVCVAPVVVFSVWLTIVVIAPEATLGRPWMRALGASGAALLLLGVGLAMLAGRALIQSMTRLAEAAHARDAQLAAIVDQATAGIAQTDLEGRVMLVNQRYCDLVGRTREAVMGGSFADTVDAE
ncbi:MAG TPA: PAS domain-containing protein, partial [Candidatus Udaeobacter sp.]|nr:PAS domain-containing protein [Candidatus Udaeobacter sp.]